MDEEKASEQSAELRADLESADADRVAAALKVLAAGAAQFALIRLPMPVPDVLGAFGETPPLPVVSDYIRAVGDFPAFDPGPSPSERCEAMVVAFVFFGHGDGQLAYDIAMRLQVSSSGPYLTKLTLDFLGGQDGENPDVVRAATNLVGNLLDSPHTREATVEELARWVLFQRLSDVVAAVRGRLTADEAARLTVDD